MSRLKKFLFTGLIGGALAATAAMAPPERVVTECHSYAYCDAGCQATVENTLCSGGWQSGWCAEGCETALQ